MIKGKFRLPGWMRVLSKIGEGKTYSHQVYKSIDISDSYVNHPHLKFNLGRGLNREV